MGPQQTFVRQGPFRVLVKPSLIASVVKANNQQFDAH